MLRDVADFPHPTAKAFLADTAEPVRILRHNPDSTSFVSLQPTRDNPLIGKLASGSRTVPTADLCATLEEAQGLAPRTLPQRKPKRRLRTKDRARAN